MVWVIVMEYALQGSSLDCTLLADELQMRSVAKQVVTCVGRLHALQLVHCDIKCQHFLRFRIGSFDAWRLIDFGSTHRVKEQALPCMTTAYVARQICAFI